MSVHKMYIVRLITAVLKLVKHTNGSKFEKLNRTLMVQFPFESRFYTSWKTKPNRTRIKISKLYNLSKIKNILTYPPHKKILQNVQDIEQKMSLVFISKLLICLLSILSSNKSRNPGFNFKLEICLSF